MSHASNSSLLQQHRPDSLPPQRHDPSVVVSQAQAQWLEQHEHTQQLLCRSKGSDVAAPVTRHSCHDARPLAPAPPPSSHPSSSQMSISHEPVPITASALTYLSMKPTSGQSREHAVADVRSSVSESSDNIHNSCANLLAHAQVTAIGEALSKDKWQPDASSALCTFPLCTANFAQTNYFFLGPRRHHCRLCGQLFCGAHSSQRAPLIHSLGGGAAGASAPELGSRRVAYERVCDMCLPRPDAGDSTPSLAGTSGLTSASDLPHLRKDSASESDPFSDSSSNLVTPAGDDGPSSSAYSLLPTWSRDRTALPTAALLPRASPVEGPALAPIEPWMDRSGVLSLYPLAVNPSHSRSRRSPSPAPAAGPLFAPSLKSRRAAAAKEAERQTLRQRRQTGADDFWLPGKWGYKREDFDPTWREEGEEEGELEVVLGGGGGMVEDGPIRFRSGRRITPVVTPAAK